MVGRLTDAFCRVKTKRQATYIHGISWYHMAVSSCSIASAVEAIRPSSGFLKKGKTRTARCEASATMFVAPAAAHFQSGKSMEVSCSCLHAES